MIAAVGCASYFYARDLHHFTQELHSVGIALAYGLAFSQTTIDGKCSMILFRIFDCSRYILAVVNNVIVNITKLFVIRSIHLGICHDFFCFISHLAIQIVVFPAAKFYKKRSRIGICVILHAGVQTKGHKPCGKIQRSVHIIFCVRAFSCYVGIQTKFSLRAFCEIKLKNSGSCSDGVGGRVGQCRRRSGP